MRSFGIRIAIALGMAAGPLTIPPAEATTTKLGVMTGVVRLGTGFGDPCTPQNMHQCPPEPNTTFASDPKGAPRLHVSPNGNSSGFGFFSNACVKGSVSVAKDDKFSGASLCMVNGVGLATGFCELFTAQGVLTLTDLNVLILKEQIVLPWTLTAISGYLYVTGGNTSTHIYIVMSIQESSSPGGPSCTTKTQTTWTMTGTFVYKDLNPN